MGRMENNRAKKHDKVLLCTAIVGLLKVIVDLAVAIIERIQR